MILSFLPGLRHIIIKVKKMKLKAVNGNVWSKEIVLQAKQKCRAGYTSILAYFYISNKNDLTKQIMASKCRFMKSKNAFIIKLPNLA